VSAIRTGSQIRIRSRTATPSSSDSTSTCTWHPQVSCSTAVRPNRWIILWYRNPGVAVDWTGRGDVASATERAPTIRAAASALILRVVMSRARSSRLVRGSVQVSICSCFISLLSPSSSLRRSSNSPSGTAWPLALSTMRNSSSTPTRRITVGLWSQRFPPRELLHGEAENLYGCEAFLLLGSNLEAFGLTSVSREHSKHAYFLCAS